ncbi:hypothetical protein Tco_0821080 [Tanacetum coccineum]|uniref:Uncharacterized protein n=1 Tax=Tanacetum coccineum TaxID=301880 RepID=A0ABQ5AFH3_9ASTR
MQKPTGSDDINRILDFLRLLHRRKKQALAENIGKGKDGKRNDLRTLKRTGPEFRMNLTSSSKSLLKPPFPSVLDVPNHQLIGINAMIRQINYKVVSESTLQDRLLFFVCSLPGWEARILYSSGEINMLFIESETVYKHFTNSKGDPFIWGIRTKDLLKLYGMGVDQIFSEGDVSILLSEAQERMLKAQNQIAAGHKFLLLDYKIDIKGKKEHKQAKNRQETEKTIHRERFEEIKNRSKPDSKSSKEQSERSNDPLTTKFAKLKAHLNVLKVKGQKLSER